MTGDKILRAAVFFILLVAISYFGFTWYHYGSVHPCGILKARMLPYRVDVERQAAMALERKHSKEGEATQFRDPEIRRMIQQDWQRINAAPEIAAQKIDAEIATFSLRQCIVDALTWHLSDGLRNP